jgi:hypothetical protein
VEGAGIRWNFLETRWKLLLKAGNFASQAWGQMAQDIDRKLRLTAAVLGTVTRKDLAAAFRRVNPATAFDVDRANKWLQGRAHPRQLSVYEDWSKLLKLDRSGAWIADCDVEDFIIAVCEQHGVDRIQLERRSESASRGTSSSARDGHGLDLSGTYACYSHAWSPFHPKDLMRGVLTIETKAAAAPVATYEEQLPTLRFKVKGPIAAGKRGISLNLEEPGGDFKFLFSLFPASPPVSALGGYMMGPTIIGLEPHPCVSRTIFLRLPAVPPKLAEWGGYLPFAGSIAADVAGLGLKLDDRKAADQCIKRFIGGAGRSGTDQIPSADFRALLEVFDRCWLAQQTAPAVTPRRARK